MLFKSDSELGSPSRLLAIAVFVALVAATLTAVVRNRPVAQWTRVDPSKPTDTVEAPEAQQMAVVWVDAVPWGKIERIASPEGELYPLPSPAETPVMLELPPGEWIVTLTYPDAEEERQCELTLSFDAPASCRVEFEQLSVDDYFREAGWWR